MPVFHNTVDTSKFNRAAVLPFQMRREDVQLAMQDVYDFFFDVNVGLVDRGLERLDDMLRPAIMSGLLSDLLTASLGKHCRTLTVNLYHNGHPDLIVKGVYPANRVMAGSEGVDARLRRGGREGISQT